MAMDLGVPLLCIFQFTPLREGRRLQGFPDGWGIPISIHAPPRGATHQAEMMSIADTISIHAPPRGATARDAGTKRGTSDFNSRPSARGDKGVVILMD